MNRLKAIVSWFTAVPGRKRAISAVLLVIGDGLRFVDSAFRQLCDAAVLAGNLCSLHPANWVVYADAVNAWLQQYVVPGADAAGVLMGLWGVLHAVQRNRAVAGVGAVAALKAAVTQAHPPASAAK